MYKRQPETADCGYCEGNRQLLNQLLADVATLSEKVATSPALSLESLRIEVAHLGPDDYLVLTAPQRLCDDQVSNLISNVRATVPNAKVIILDGGLQLSVVHPDGGA